MNLCFGVADRLRFVQKDAPPRNRIEWVKAARWEQLRDTVLLPRFVLVRYVYRGFLLPNGYAGCGDHDIELDQVSVAVLVGRFEADYVAFIWTPILAAIHSNERNTRTYGRYKF